MLPTPMREATNQGRAFFDQPVPIRCHPLVEGSAPPIDGKVVVLRCPRLTVFMSSAPNARYDGVFAVQ